MIIDGNRLYEQAVGCNGIMFVGDPHLSSRRPGRRKDEDWPGPILRKFEACAALARSKGYATVLLGDLFEEPVERDEGLKTRTIRILRGFPMVPLSNTGNHDITNTILSDGDSLAMLATSDAIDVVRTSGAVCEFTLGSRRIGIGMTPYGQEIPRSVVGMFPDADVVVWVTHHDIAFEGAYPNAMQPFEIAGCKIVVNGHIHDTKPPIKTGQTMWMNPGNINRQTVDLIDHVPSVWILHEDGRFESQPLPYEKAVFDLTGKFVEAIRETDLVREVDSAFVTMLQAESTMEMSVSADGSLLLEEIEAKFKRDRTPEVVQSSIRSLLTEAAARRHAA